MIRHELDARSTDEAVVCSALGTDDVADMFRDVFLGVYRGRHVSEVLRRK